MNPYDLCPEMIRRSSHRLQCKYDAGYVFSCNIAATSLCRHRLTDILVSASLQSREWSVLCLQSESDMDIERSAGPLQSQSWRPHWFLSHGNWASDFLSSSIHFMREPMLAESGLSMDMICKGSVPLRVGALSFLRTLLRAQLRWYVVACTTSVYAFCSSTRTTIL